MSDILSVAEVAERYRVARVKVLAWIKSGQLQALDVSSPESTVPRYRVTPEACEAFEKLRSTSAPAQRTSRKRKQPAGKFYE